MSGRVLAAAAVLLSALLRPAPLLAMAAPQGEEAAEPADEHLPVEGEPVLVEASLPYVPTANTIASKLPVALDRTPANVGVVSGLLLEEQDARVLGDALENVSGVNVQTGFGVIDFFVVRGFDSLTSGLVLTDGAPEPEATFYQLYNAERVEVLKGPGGFLYGSNPLAGAVNIVRKQPIPTSRSSVEVAAGSHGRLDGRFDLNLAGDSGGLSFRLNGLWRESDGYRDGRSSRVAAVNPAITWRPTETTVLNLNLELLESDFMPDAGLPVIGGSLPAVPRTRSYASPFDRSVQDLRRFQLDFETRLSSAVALRNKLYYRELDWISDGTLIGPALPDGFGGLALVRTLLLLDDRQRFLGNQLEVVITARRGRAEHRLLAGIEVGRTTDEFTLDVALLPAIDVFRPVESAARPLFLLPGQSAAGDSRTRIVAPYLLDQIALGERWQVLLGARLDRLDFADATSGEERRDTELSPMAGVVFAPRDDLALYANLSRSFAPPSPRVSGPRRPERSRQVEIGVRRKLLSDRVTATLALFELERENIAIPDDNGFTQQAGDQRSRGLEAELAAELPAGFRAFLAYAYTDSELTRFAEAVFLPGQPPSLAVFDRSGNRSAFSPRHLLNLWLSRGLAGGFRVGGGARYVGSQFIAEDNATELDGYALFDAAVSYSRGPLRWTLHLENLTDEDYETRGFGAASVIPAPPRGAALRMEYRR